MGFVRSRWFIGALRILGVALVIYAFAVVLMTAAAQQQVISGLRAVDAEVGYSSAHARVLELEALRDELKALTSQEQTLAREQREAEFRYQELVSNSDAAWGELESAYQPLAARGICGDRTGAEPMALWHSARRCLGADELSAPDRVALQTVVSGPPNAETLHRDRLAQARVADRAYNQLQATRNAIAAVREKERSGDTVRRAFDEMTVLRRGWLPGAAQLVYFPPTLVQIMLAFASGLFGALLITLVLSVYPKSSVSFTAGEGFGARVLLGGLIAVGVFIVTSGGASILGTPTELGAAPSNIMTFCALGILAGMFSDRVAFWLSEKAEVFFARDGRRAEDDGKP